MADALDDLHEFIEYRVLEGFETPHEIVKNAYDWTCFRYQRDDLLPEIERLTVGALKAHQAEEATWV